MTITLVCAVFPPEPLTSAITGAELASSLASRGHHVTVITAFPSRPGGRVYPGFTPRPRTIERSPSGYDLHRVWSFTPTGSGPFAARCLECLSFSLAVALDLITMSPDVIVVNAWPIASTGILTLLARLRRIPVIAAVQDIYPEAIAAAGRLSPDGSLYRALQRLDTAIAHRISALVLISHGFLRFYTTSRGVPPERIRVIPNWMDARAIAPAPKDNAFRRSLGIRPDDFVAMYAGNVGALSGVTMILDAAALLLHHPEILFVIAGDGSELSHCREIVASRGLHNVRFHSPWIHEPVAELQAAADLMLLTQKPGSARTSVPSKLIAYLLSGRPVVAVVDPQSDAAEIVRQSAAGMVIPSHDVDGLARAILELRRSPRRLDAMGGSARDFAVRHFSRESCLPQWTDLIEEVTLQRRQSPQRPNRALPTALLIVIAAIVFLSLKPAPLGPVAMVNSAPAHAVAYGVAALLAVPLSRCTLRKALAAVALLLLGLTLELIQTRIPGRAFEWTDLAANAAGILAAFSILFVRRRGRPPTT